MRNVRCPVDRVLMPEGGCRVKFDHADKLRVLKNMSLSIEMVSPLSRSTSSTRSGELFNTYQCFGTGTRYCPTSTLSWRRCQNQASIRYIGMKETRIYTAAPQPTIKAAILKPESTCRQIGRGSRFINNSADAAHKLSTIICRKRKHLYRQPDVCLCSSAFICG